MTNPHSIESIVPICRKLHAAGLKLTLATGFFDLLHEEHIKFLKKAKEAGDILIVAVESDARAHKIKGEGRPIEPQSLRCQKVGDYADFVIALGDDFDNQEAYLTLLRTVKPHIYAVSSSTSFLDNKKMMIEQVGGQLVVVHDWNPKVSTTRILAQKQKT